MHIAQPPTAQPANSNGSPLGMTEERALRLAPDLDDRCMAVVGNAQLAVYAFNTLVRLYEDAPHEQIDDGVLIRNERMLSKVLPALKEAGLLDEASF